MKITHILLFASVLCVSRCLNAQVQTVSIAVTDSVSVEMVLVEGGEYTMGCSVVTDKKHPYDYARPAHKVLLSDYYIAKYEVTQCLWRAVMDTNNAYFRGSDSLPVEMVTWHDAQEFVMLLSVKTGRRFRLPTEAEWEYAARGGKYSQGFRYSGGERKELNRYCWYCSISQGYTHRVGMLMPNELGLYDMSGNVAEWCADMMGDYSAQRQENPQGADEGDSRILRGGHYNSTSSACVVFDRSWYVPTGKAEYIGLRVVMDIEEEVDDDPEDDD